MSLYTSLEKVVAGNRKSLLAALESLSGFDCDFNGENGLEYLWDEVWKANGFESLEDYEKKQEYDSDEDEDYEEIELKYESNVKWLLNEVKDIEDEGECVKTFFETWMEHDKNYYDEHEVNYIRNTKGKIIAVSFAVNGSY